MPRDGRPHAVGQEDPGEAMKAKKVTKAELRKLVRGQLDRRAIAILREQGPMKGSDLGWALWGESTPYPRRGEGSHAQNKFCRVAGKLLRRLEREGKVVWTPAEKYVLWHAI